MIEFAAVLLIGAVVLGFFVLRRPEGKRAPARRAGAAARRAPAVDGAQPAPVDPNAPPDVQLTRLRRSDAFWGVMVRVPPGQGCAAAQAARETRYPLERAPQLPLPGCDAPQCRCGYTGLKERRRKDVLPPERPDQRKGSKITWDIYKS